MNMPGLNVICWKLTRILFLKVAKFYRRLYGGVGLSSCPPYSNACKWSNILIRF